MLTSHYRLGEDYLELPYVLWGLRKCFVLYVSMPKSRWPDIRRAEADTPEGNRIYAELKQEYMEKYFKAPVDNPNAEIANVADLEYGMKAI